MARTQTPTATAPTRQTAGLPWSSGSRSRRLLSSSLPIEALLDDLNISVESPLGRALVGRRVGDQVEVDAPDGRFRCRILTTARHQTAARSWPRHLGPGRPVLRQAA